MIPDANLSVLGAERDRYAGTTHGVLDPYRVWPVLLSNTNTDPAPACAPIVAHSRSKASHNACQHQRGRTFNGAFPLDDMTISDIRRSDLPPSV